MTTEELKQKIADYKRWAQQVRASAARAERSSDASRDRDRAYSYDQEAKKLEAELRELEGQ